MSGKSWVHRLMFDAYFEDALMHYRAKTGFGTTYALFNILNEALYREGFMDEKGYIFHKERYGRGLIDELERQLENQDKSVRFKIKKKEMEIEKLTQQLTNVFNQWDQMKPSSQAYYLRKAKENSQLSIAQRILERNVKK